MDSMLLNVILVFVGSLIGSIGSSSVLLYLLKRKDRVEELAERNNRIGEALNLVMETQVLLIDTLREGGVLNGEGKAMKEKIEDYLATCTKKGFMI